MYNYNSPIMNNMFNPTMPQPQQQPFYQGTIGNMVSMSPGYNGAMNNMGGYYGGMHQGYYNPYLIEQQRKEAEARQRQVEIQNAEILKMVSRNVNKALGMTDEQIQEHVKKYDPQFVQETRLTDKQIAEMNTAKLMDLDSRPQTMSYQQQMYMSAVIKERQRMNEAFPPEMGLAEFFEKFGEEEYNMKMQELKSQQRQLNNLYNSSQYNDLLNMHNSSSNYFNSVFGKGQNNIPTTIDDLEVKLPSSISQEMQMKKMKFLNAIGRR